MVKMELVHVHASQVHVPHDIDCILHLQLQQRLVIATWLFGCLHGIGSLVCCNSLVPQRYAWIHCKHSWQHMWPGALQAPCVRAQRIPAQSLPILRWQTCSAMPCQLVQLKIPSSPLQAFFSTVNKAGRKNGSFLWLKSSSASTKGQMHGM